MMAVKIKVYQNKCVQVLDTCVQKLDSTRNNIFRKIMKDSVLHFWHRHCFI